MMTTTRPAAYDLHCVPDSPDTGGWKTRHAAAVRNPRKYEKPLLKAIDAWIAMALQQRERFVTPIGQDSFASDHWAAIGTSLRALLNLDWGPRLDMGTLDTIIVDTLETEGYDVDADRWKGERS